MTQAKQSPENSGRFIPTVPRHREIARFAVALAGAVVLIFMLGKLGIFRKK